MCDVYTLSIANCNPQVWDETMDGNKDAFVESGSEGIQAVLDSPGLLLFDTNWWEDSYQKLVALKIQDEAPISAAFAFQKGSEFLHLFNHFLKKLLEGGIIYKVTMLACHYFLLTVES